MSLNSSFHTGLTGLPWKNTSDTEAPPYAAISGWHSEYSPEKKLFVILGAKPNQKDVANPFRIFYANGPTKVSAGDYGTCYPMSGVPVWVKYSEETPAFSYDQNYFNYGPKADSWDWDWYESVNPITRTYAAETIGPGSATVTGGRVLAVGDLLGSYSKYRILRVVGRVGNDGATDRYLDSNEIKKNCDVIGNTPWIDGVFTYKLPTDPGLRDYGASDQIGTTGSEPLKIFAGDSLHGVLMNGSVCMAIPFYLSGLPQSGSEFTDDVGWIAISGGETSFTGVVSKISEHPKYSVIPDNILDVLDGFFLTGGESDSGVSCYSAFGDSFSIGQRVAVTWDSRPRRLRITDWGCPT